MRENDQFIGRVEDYLVEFDGDTPLPGRVLDAIHAELPRTRQAKAGPGFMRMPPMLSTLSSRAPLGVAAAIVILAVVVGISFMNRSSDQPAVGGVPAASLTPPSSQSRTTLLKNAPAAACPGISKALDCLEPGTYQLGSTPLWPAIVTFDVPANWWYYQETGYGTGALVQTKDALFGSGWGFNVNSVSSVSIDPCDMTAGKVDAKSRTPNELYDVIAAWPGFEASEPEPISAGYDGLRFTLTSTKTTADCPSPLTWTSSTSGPIGAYPMVNAQGRRHEAEIRIYDIDGEPIVLMATNFPETSPFEEDNGIPFDPERHAEHQVELNAILDSIDLKDPQGGAN